MQMSRRTPTTINAAILLAAVLFAWLSCAPASSNEGVDVGNTVPPFAMTLENGSEMSVKDLVDDNQAVHLFWFATW